MLGPELANPRERRLLKCFRALNATDREALEAFAAFLAQRHTAEKGQNARPAPPPYEPRPEQETVIAAIKRLRRNHPGLDAAALLDKASLLMSGHLLQGRPAAEIIDELEALFARHAATHEATQGQAPADP